MIYPHDRGAIDYREYVPENLYGDYRKAIESQDPEASAMFSRKCLERLIHECFGIDKGNLGREIAAVVKQNLLPSELAQELRVIQSVGNHAVHPRGSPAQEERVEVGPGDAECLVEILEALFDLLFVAPKKAERRRSVLNRRLLEAGKRQLRVGRVIPFPVVERK
ncbi:MAG: DUF4145 domain-containing protein [Acidobacteria bacterium]|nr:DUF4145 domain-containing protein [Acidobacteriota bacterium]